MTIVEFLTAQLDYEQRLARESRSTLLIADLDRCKVPGSDEQATFRHHERWEPRRVLADVAARRRIIELHRPIEDKSWLSGEPNNWLWCASCGSMDDRPIAYPCDTLRLLTQPYADHPGFDPAWASGVPTIRKISKESGSDVG